MPSIVPGFFIALTAAALFVDPEIGQGSASSTARPSSWRWSPSRSIARRRSRCCMLPAPQPRSSSSATPFPAASASTCSAKTITLEGFPLLPSGAGIVRAGIAIGAVFAARRIVECAPPRGGAGRARRDLGRVGRRRSAGHPVLGLARLRQSRPRSRSCGGGHCAGRGIRARRRNDRARRSAAAVRAARPSPSRWPAPASRLLLALHMAFSPGWTTMLLGAALALPALATRYRSYPVLGWLSAAGAVVVLLRFAIDPSIVGLVRPVDDAGVQLAAAGLRRAGARCCVRGLAARPHHRWPAAAGHGGGGLVLCADRRGHAGPPRHEWRRHRRGCR